MATNSEAISVHDQLSKLVLDVWERHGEQITEISIQWIEVQRYGGQPGALGITGIKVRTESHKNFL